MKVTAISGDASTQMQQPVNVKIRSRSPPALGIGKGTNIEDYSQYDVALLINHHNTVNYCLEQRTQEQDTDESKAEPKRHCLSKSGSMDL